MSIFEAEALEALRETFIDRYVTLHPRIENCIPDAITFELGGFLRISGFEVKATRQDWRQELKTKKNSAGQAVCDFWSIIGKESAVKNSDIPAGSGWGLYRLENGRLTCEIQPSQLTNPGPISRDLASHLLHAVFNTTPLTSQVSKMREAIYKEVFELIFGEPVFFKMGINKMQAFAKIFETRAELKAIHHLSEIQAKALQLSKDIGECLSKIPIPKDWESGELFPPEAKELSERLKTTLLENKSVGVLFREKPEFLEAAIHQRLLNYYGLKE